jgi:UDP-N-acetylglucosamine 2-epimerase
VVTESLLAEAQIKATLDAIVRLHYPTTAIYPNADAGGRQMIKVMKRYAERYPFIRLRRNIPREDYLGLMAISSVIVGNSSSGIIEAASFGLPSVNIGSRQLGRTQPANIQNVGCDEREITEAIKLALSTTFRSRLRGLRNPYGDGRTAPRLVRILRQLRITPSFLQKRLEVA